MPKGDYKWNKSKGLCPACCRRPPVEGQWACAHCLKLRAAQMRRYYLKNRAKLQARARARYYASKGRKAIQHPASATQSSASTQAA